VLTAATALVGVWLEPRPQPAPVQDDPAALRTRIDQNELLIIDLSVVLAGGRLAAAVRAGAQQLQPAAPALLCAIDVAAARRAGVRPLPARLEDETEVLGLLPALAAALGPVGCVVNNASRFEFDEAADIGFGSFTAHLLPNLAAPVVLARELHRLLPGDAEGVVVNLLDQKLYAFNPDFLSYSLSKAGLAAATTMLAQALAPRVRVVGVAPGLTLPSYLQDDDRFAHAHREHSPLGRSSTAADVAASVAFAVANRSITGSTILCDGGQHLRPLPRDVSLMP
jgi:NAD(P)-dependent dehydrogenase (short-subunit alcohol dehydrogenase family)